MGVNGMYYMACKISTVVALYYDLIWACLASSTVRAMRLMSNITSPSQKLI